MRMARPLRVEYPGAWFHVTARGNERRAIFRNENDRRKWLALLAELPARFGLRLHGYVQMPNHFHLLLETGPLGLSRAMQWLNLSYTVWFNRRHRRVGHLFQGRFKAVLVEPDRWGLELSRYLHLNPVRIAKFGLGKGDRAARRVGLGRALSAPEVAERVRALREFRWSSYRAYVGLEVPPPWLCVETLRAKLGVRPGAAKLRYRAYIEEAIRDGIEQSPWDEVHAQLLLGGVSLKAKVCSLLQGERRERSGVRELERRNFGEVIAVISQLKGEPWEEFRDRHGDWGRDLGLWLGRTHGGLRLRELGGLTGGLDYVTVSMAVQRFRKRIAEDRLIAKLANQSVKMFNAKI